VFVLTFTINQNSTDLVQSYQFHHSTAFVSMLLLSLNKQAKPKKWCFFLQANECVSRFPCLSPFFLPSTKSYFSLSLSYCSGSETAPCINIQTVSSRQRIRILHKTCITEFHNNLSSRKVKSQEITIYNEILKYFNPLYIYYLFHGHAEYKTVKSRYYFILSCIIGNSPLQISRLRPTLMYNIATHLTDMAYENVGWILLVR